MARPRPFAYLVGCATLVVLVGALIVRYRLMDELLIVLLPPILFAAIHYSRVIYLFLTLEITAASAVAAYYVAPNYTGALQTIAMLSVSFIAICELLRGVIRARYDAEERLRALAEATACVVGQDFFEVAASHLARLLDVKHAFIGERTGPNQDRIRTLAYWANHALGENFEYVLADSPCETVVARQLCYYPERVWERFPRDHLLKEMHIECYIGAPLFDSSGQPLGLVAAMDDKPGRGLDRNRAILEILAARASVELERLRTETALRDSEERFRAIAEQSLVGIYILTDEGFAFVNEACARALGMPREKVLGWTLDDFIRRAHPEDQAFVLEQAQKKLAHRSDAVEHYDFRGIDPQGEVHWFSLFSRAAHFQGRNAILAVIIDMTDRKRAEQAREDAVARFQALFDNTPMVAIQGFDREGVLHHWNPASERLYGHSEAEVVGKRLQDLVLPEGAVRDFETTIARIWESGQALGPMEFRVYTRQREERWIYATMFPVFSGGAVTEIYCMDVDITARKQAEEERLALEAHVQHAQKLESLGVLAGGIAHDFNNLLVGILGNAELAISDISAASPAQEHLDSIVTASQRAADLCRQMLAYSGKGRFVVQPLNLSEVVEEMTHLLQVSASKKATLRYDFSEDLPTVEADATQLRQVIMNLITNASDAIGEKNGVISISTGAMDCDRHYLGGAYVDENLPEGRYVFLEVSDTGCGMDEETRHRVFDPFFTTKFTGRGLGLAAVLGIVRSHKGAIKVYSEPGRGSTFKVLLPACERPAEVPYGTRPPPPAFQGAGTILVADDEEMVRELARKILERAGFTVYVARDGREAVDLYREHAHELAAVILDMTMPRLSGEEAFREMRRISPSVPILLSSGYNEQDATSRFAGKGLAGFIHKPYRQAELFAALRAVLSP